MNKLILIIVGMLISAHSFAADEPDKRNPLDRYHGDSQYYLMMCKLSLTIAISSNALGETNKDGDYKGCINKGKETVKKSLSAALRTVKNPKAKEALKSYHVAFATALDGINPGSDERKINYEQRQQALEEKVTEAWARFEVEL